MKRTLALILMAVVSAAAAVPAKTAKTAAQNSKAPVTTVKVAAKRAPKPTVVAVKPSAVPAAKPVTGAHVAAVVAKPAAPRKPVERSVKTVMVPVNVNSAPAPKAAEVSVAVPEKSVAVSQDPVAVQDNKTDADKSDKPISTASHRDPFVSPVINMGATGSGCSSGKRCLAIDEVALKGVVKSEAGMIAVVVNALDKAYFLRENVPVFNGYVLKITGASIVFKETFHDKLGKPLTRDVTKTIVRPVA